MKALSSTSIYLGFNLNQSFESPRKNRIEEGAVFPNITSNKCNEIALLPLWKNLIVNVASQANKNYE